MKIEIERKAPDSNAERSKRHRLRRKSQQGQMAIAIAKLVTGQNLGDHRLFLKDYLTKFAEPDVLPDDQMVMIDNALDKLGSRARF